MLARFEQHQGTNYNPFCVRPSWDGERARLLVFDAGDRVRILGRGDETLLEVSTFSPTNECRCGALSYSGKWLALYRASRFLIYGHKDAQHDSTNWIEVWDIDAKALVRQVPVMRKIERVGFDPSEKRLLFSHEFAQGPGELSIDTGEELWHNEGPFRTDRWGTCFSWRHSPDGQILAVGGFGLRFLDTVGHTPSITQPGEPRVVQRVYRIVYSADGSIVASGGDHGRLQVHKV